MGWSSVPSCQAGELERRQNAREFAGTNGASGESDAAGGIARNAPREGTEEGVAE
jgi:hypothetical protein